MLSLHRQTPMRASLRKPPAFTAVQSTDLTQPTAIHQIKKSEDEAMHESLPVQPSGYVFEFTYCTTAHKKTFM